MADLIIMRQGATEEEIEKVVKKIEKLGFQAHISRGTERTIIGIIGDTREISDEVFRVLPGVSEVISILKEYKLASRDFHPNDTIIDVNGIKIGEGYFVIMAGPCSVESKEQLYKTAKYVKEKGAKILRGAVFKPRTSPYSFLGLGAEGLKIIKEIKEELEIPVITEVMSPEEVEIVSEVSDILQIGTRNMFNYRLLQKVGRIDKPVLLKRNFSAKISEFLNCAEYILKEGNNKVILCERGIRTFDSEFTRNILDLSAIPILKKETHLPIIVDPSHGTGRRDLVIPMSKAAIGAGADGLIIEVHPKPEEALSDGFQSITLDMFSNLMNEITPFIEITKKKM
ncbi:MAG: 3-deoxy-7-phosphoheptulonate synthase [bacterium]|nr:3-deoxy-7-phosphoheptulonate synthase [bacterium]MCX7916960.1 3-deoxy-7-phosphoheptulonate synthase [bacterium]MDW8164204.1 3-deoxy-7-phosphoheptulonate synthase [Candidatus Omnitrophota bacterium]